MEKTKPAMTNSQDSVGATEGRFGNPTTIFSMLNVH